MWRWSAVTRVTNKVPVEEREKSDERAQLRRHQIANATPAQIDNYIDNNVTDLESAKDVLKLLAKFVILNAKN